MFWDMYLHQFQKNQDNDKTMITDAKCKEAIKFAIGDTRRDMKFDL